MYVFFVGITGNQHGDDTSYLAGNSPHRVNATFLSWKYMELFSAHDLSTLESCPLGMHYNVSSIISIYFISHRYVPWNLHETYPGKFDFDGRLDLR